MLMKRLTLAIAVALPATAGSFSAAAAADTSSSAATADTRTVAAAGVTDSTLAPVEVRAAAEAAGAAATLDGERLRALRAATSDSANLLRSLPGVSVYGAGGVSSLPVIRGLGDDRIRIQVDDMALISSCGNHMNPPLSYIDPSALDNVQVFAGITPVSLGGDSIAGTIRVESAPPRFAADGKALLLEGEIGGFYRSNGHVAGSNLAATVATPTLSATYRANTVEADNYRAGGKFKPAGPSYATTMATPVPSTVFLDGNEVGSSMYKATNQSLGLALRNDAHLLEFKVGVQDIPYQGFSNQRMDMTGNDSEQATLRYRGRYDWGQLRARLYRERTRHRMNFGDDKAFWYMGGAAGMPMDTKGETFGAGVDAEIIVSERALLRVGGEYQRYRLDDWWKPSGRGGMSPNTFRSIADGKRDRSALFAEWETSWSAQWMSLVGVRGELVESSAGRVHGYNPNYDGDAQAFNAGRRQARDHNWDFTALARHTPNAGHTHEIGYARKTRSPNPYERYSWSTGGMAMNMINMAGDGNGYVGDPRLRPEVAHTISANFDWHDAEQQAWGFSITPYYSYVENYINARRCASADSHMAGSVCNAANLLRRDNFVFLKYANVDAQLYGIDVAGHLPLARHTALGSFGVRAMLSYTRGKTASGKRDDLYNIMPLHASVALDQQLGNWNASAEVLAVAGKTHVSATRNELKTPGYALLNLRASYDWQRVRVDFGIDNVFDRLYFHPLAGAYLGQGTTMPPLHANAPYGIAVPGMGRSLYAGVNVKF